MYKRQGEETRAQVSLSRFSPAVKTALRAAHCGTVALSLSDAAVQDWFGLYRRPLTLQSSRFTTIEPPLFSIQIALAERESAVSYTHLDVYKRQG